MVTRHIALMTAMLAAFAVFALGACGKTEPAKTGEQRAADKTANDKAVRDNAVWGNQVKALDKAKAVQGTVDAQAEDARKKIEDSSK